MIQQEYASRRQALTRKMVAGSAALFFAAPEVTRSRDSDYPFRQNSDFWYMTGFNEPQSLLVIIKSRENTNRCVLFNRVRCPSQEIWSERRLGQEAALEKLGVDSALPWDDTARQLPLLLSGLDIVYHAQGLYPFADDIVFSSLEQLRQGERNNLQAPATLTDWRPIVHEMRLFKSAAELEIMREAGRISARAHTRAMQCCRPDMYEYQLEAEIQHEFTYHGARFPAYSTIVGAGENGCILHYTENSCRMQAGEMVLVDAGCEYHGYAADITRTFPVNGKFTVAQRALYDIVLASFYKALELLRPGTTIRQVNGHVIQIMVTMLQAIGLLKGDTDTLIAEGAVRQFYMHGLSHWLGLDVHDVSGFGAGQDRILEPGMVITVEPGLYIAPDAKVPEAFRGIGIRIEDNIVINASGNDNLTDSVVKDPDAIEALMAAASR